MPNVELAFNELIGVVRHLVDTHVHWNIDLSRDEAIAKLEAAKVHAVTGDVVETVGAITSAVEDVRNSNLAATVTDGVSVVKDVEAAVADVKATVTPNE